MRSVLAKGQHLTRKVVFRSILKCNLSPSIHYQQPLWLLAGLFQSGYYPLFQLRGLFLGGALCYAFDFDYCITFWEGDLPIVPARFRVGDDATEKFKHLLYFKLQCSSSAKKELILRFQFFYLALKFR